MDCRDEGWIVEMKERVADAFAYDPAYALAWVEIPDGTRYEDLATLPTEAA